MPDNSLRFLFLGDLVGRAGRAMFQKWARKLKEQHKADVIVVNGENSADSGKGITPRVVNFFEHNGASVITTGNHIWAQRDIYQFISESDTLIRPANFPPGCPGKGFVIKEISGFKYAVVNLQGRVFMHEHLDCPFRTIDNLLTTLKNKVNIIFVDFHAETTSEKQGIGFYLDGKVSGVFGTHTHVQTADERVLPGGTAFISDLGFSGSMESMLGMKRDDIIKRFMTQMPIKITVELNGTMMMTGVVVEVDAYSGKALSIERVKIVDSEIAHTITGNNELG